MPETKKKDAFQEAGAATIKRNTAFTSAAVQAAAANLPPTPVSLAPPPTQTTATASVYTPPTPAPGLVPPPPPPGSVSDADLYAQGYAQGLAGGAPPPNTGNPNSPMQRGYRDGAAAKAQQVAGTDPRTGEQQLAANQIRLTGNEGPWPAGVYTVNADGSAMYDAQGQRWEVPENYHGARAAGPVDPSVPLYKDGKPANEAAYAQVAGGYYGETPSEVSANDAAAQAQSDGAITGSGGDPLPTVDDLPTVDELTQEMLAANPPTDSYAAPVSTRAALLPAPPVPSSSSTSLWLWLGLGAYLLKRFVF